ncbi:MAG: hypothetical protein K2G69_03905, partial [Muribaculaceae bacterium]|nr:hypothetical protein [Muribaculaceae bacterium]
MGEIIIHNATLVKEVKALSASIAPLSNDPLNQVYEEETNSYIPDRAAALPLTLEATVTQGGQDASALISSQGWYMINGNGTEVQITSSTPGYSLITTSTPMRLKVMVNTPYHTPSKYIYRCKVGQESATAVITLRTTINPKPNPTLEIDASASIVWNPFEPSSKDIIKITPTIHARGHTGLTTRWRKIDAGTVRAIDTNDPKDIELSLDGTAIKIDRRLMGKSVSLVCELLNGADVVDKRYVTFTRRIPEYECRVNGSPVFSEADAKLFREIEVIIKPGGPVVDPSQELRIQW